MIAIWEEMVAHLALLGITYHASSIYVFHLPTSHSPGMGLWVLRLKERSWHCSWGDSNRRGHYVHDSIGPSGWGWGRGWSQHGGLSCHLLHWHFWQHVCHNRGGVIVSYLIVRLNKVRSGYVVVFLQVSGKFELKGHDRMRGFSSLNVHGEDQYMPRQRRDVTYISRLQVGHIQCRHTSIP